MASCNQSKEANSLEAIKIEMPEPLQKKITLEIKNYCVQTGHVKGDFYLHNASAVLQKGMAYIDFDRDGLPNYLEDDDTLFDLRTDNYDSNSDGYNDFIIYHAGFTKDEQLKLVNKCLIATQDTDFDGLNDCEEKLLGTRPDYFDTDGDGIPDVLETRFLLNSVSDQNDMVVDSDGDGISNLNEVKMNTPPDEHNRSGILNTIQITYDTFTLDQEEKCFDYKISNIPIVNSSNDNRLKLYFIERDHSKSQDKDVLYTSYVDVPTSVEHESVLKYEYSDLSFYHDTGVMP